MNRYWYYIIAAGIVAIGIQITLWVGGCSGIQLQEHYVISAATAKAVNQLAPKLLIAYDLEQQEAIEDSETQIEAEARVGLIRDRWAPVWEAFDAFTEAHTVYQRQLDIGLRPSTYEMRLAFCRLRRALPERFYLDQAILCH